MKRVLAALFLAAATGAQAIMAPKSAKGDAQRFGLNHANPIQRRAPSADSARAFHAFNANQGGKWKVRFNPRTGLPAALTGGSEGFRSGTPDVVARAFLAAHGDILGIDPSTLTLDRQTQGNGHKHVLYRQKYKGLPVDSAGVKVHLDANGSVIGVHSAYEPNLTVPTTPSVAADAADRSATADAGGGFVRGAPALVILPLESDGKNHLAWKLRVDSPNGGAWRYYVDAVTGQVLFRFSVREFACAGASGVVTGSVFDVDPSQQAPTPGTPVTRPFKNENVFVGSGASRAVTDNTGTFCSAAPGKAATSLQGPFVSVSQFRGPSAEYDNGSSSWSTVATPVSSPHPYPNNASITNTITLPPGTIAFLPVFTDFSVGTFGGGGAGAGDEGSDIIDDDRLMISDGAGSAIANYVGARGAFNGAAVHGRTMNLTLRSNDSGQEDGYDVAISSYLTMTSPDVTGAAPPSPTWTSAQTWISGQQARNVHGEISLFYHLNLMHDYFTSDTDASGAAPLNVPVVAMAHVGPNLVNAFYDPDYDDLSFGDGTFSGDAPIDAFMDDATVPHHEYTHYVVQKIWDIQNYGQAGTLSEANADYWSASSLNDPSIGTWVISQLGGSGPLREIDDTVACPTCGYFKLGGLAAPNFQTTWTGEIHSDSPFLSQALWDIRRAEIGHWGANPGRSCADGLVFQSLLYFPESFAELFEDMNAVNTLNAVTSCGGPANVATIATDIATAFGNHGISPILGDAYEPNDGFETATDISTIGAVSATIYPIADTDFYSFGAGPGLVQITMSLPSLGGGVYKDYQLKLYNASRQQVAGAAPPANAFGTLDGFCDVSDCDTTAPSVSINYNNPTGGLLYVQVIGGDTGASNSGVNSTIPYTLSVGYPQYGALSSSLVTAKFDGDTIGFTVNTSTFVSNQDWRFAYAQLRDQSGAAMPNTLAPGAASYLAFVSSSSAYGQITGSVQLVSGFAARFPSVGSVALEIFAYDVHGSTSSMGVSNQINLSDNGNSELAAYNNLFNPLTGKKATVKYAVGSPGHVTIKLYTETGRLVSTLFDGDVAAGKGSVDWGGMNSAGRVVASGIYVVHAVGPGLNTTQKIAVIK